MIDEERRFAVTGWLPKLVKTLVEIVAADRLDAHDHESIFFLLNLIAESYIPDDCKTALGDELFDSLSGFIRTLNDGEQSLSRTADGRLRRLLQGNRLNPRNLVKRRKRFYRKKEIESIFADSDEDTDSDSSDIRIAPVWGDAPRKSPLQTKNRLFSDSDGLSAVYAESHSLAFCKTPSTSSLVTSKLRKLFPTSRDKGSADSTQLFRLCLVVLLLFVSEQTRSRMLELLDERFTSSESTSVQSLAFHLDVLSTLVITSLDEHIEDVVFFERALQLTLRILRKCGENVDSNESDSQKRLISSTLRLFLYSSSHGFPQNIDYILESSGRLLSEFSEHILHQLSGLRGFVRHNASRDKCGSRLVLCLVRKLSFNADSEFKRNATSILLNDYLDTLCCSCIEPLESVEFLCALIDGESVAEGLLRLSSSLLRSRPRIDNAEATNLSMFDPLLSCFESGCSFFDLAFLNDILYVLPSVDDISYLIECTILQSLVRICSKDDRQVTDTVLGGDQEMFVALMRVLVTFMDTSTCCLTISDVITSHLQLFLSIMISSDIFPEVVSRLIKKATADRSEELLCTVYKQFEESLRVAVGDIWVLVSSSAAPFFKRLVAFLELFNLLEEEYRSVIGSKLNSDSQSLVRVCCEYISNPLKGFSCSYRIAQLLSLSLKLSNDANLFQAVVRAMEESSECTNCSLMSTLSNSFLDSAFIPNSESISLVERKMTRNEEQYDFDESDALGESRKGEGEKRYVLIAENFRFATAAIDCVQILVRKHEEFSEELEFSVRTFSNRIQAVSSTNLELLNAAVDKLLDICFDCVERDIPAGTFDFLVDSVLHVIARQPTTHHIYRVFRLIDSNPRLQTSIIKAFDRVFDHHPYQDCTVLQFPIQVDADEETPLTNEPDTVTSAAQPTAPIPRSLTVIGALERLLTSNTSHRRASHHDLEAIGTKNSSKEEDFFVNSAAALLSFDSANKTSFTEGLSVAFWIRICQNGLGDLLHVVSVGNKSLCVSLLVSPREKRVVLTITSNGVVVARKSVIPHIAANGWIHVVLSFRLVDLHTSATLLLGDSIHELSYDVALSHCNDGHSLGFGYSDVVFGAASAEATSVQYEVTSIFGFKGVLSPTAALVLRGFGFQTNSITRCVSDCHPISRLSAVFTRPILSSKRFHLGALLNDSDKFTQILQRCLLFVFNCDKPTVYGLSGLQPGVNSHLLGDMRRDGDSALFSLISFREFPVVWKRDFYQMREADQGVDNILHSFGSVKLLIFYYAQSVELSLDSNAQWTTLRVLLKALNRDPRNYSKFKHINGESLITTILTSSAAILDWNIFNEIVRFSISDLERTEEGNVNVGWTSAILDPNFVISLIFSPNIWKRQRFQFWVELMRIVACCISEGSKFSEFNLLQLKRVNFLEHMLHAVVDMMQTSKDYGSNGVKDVLITSLITVIRTLVGSPATVDTVIALWNFIFLSHPAANTYIMSSIQGYNDWLKIDSMRSPDTEPVIVGETPLSELLTNVYETLGKNRVSEIWKKTVSVTAVRKVYRECLHMHNGIDRRRTDSIISSFDSSLMDANENDDTSQDNATDIEENVPEVQENEDRGFPAEEEESSVPDSVWMDDLRSGILETLCSLLVTGSDDLVKVLFSHTAFRWECVLVLLTSQEDSRIRDSIFVFLHNFFLRCSPSVRLSFIASDGFVLLGNQMRNHGVSERIADSLFGIMCNAPIKLIDGLDENHLASLSVDKFTCASLHALFVLFEESVVDTALFWNVGGALQKIFESNSILMQAMMDSRLVETMCSVLYRMTQLPEETCDLFGVHYLASRGEMWLSFACRIISQCVPFEEMNLYNKCEELLWLALMADWQACQEGRNSSFVREQLSGLILHWINSISSSLQKEGRSASTVPSMEDLRFSVSSSELECLSDDFEVLTMDSVNQFNDFTDNPSPSFFSQSLSDIKDKFLGTQNVSKLLKVKYKWRHKMKLSNSTDLSHRVCFALEMASHLFVSLALPTAPSDVEMELFQLVLTIFCSSWKTDGSSQKRSPRRNGIDLPPVTWSGLLTISRDRVHILFAQLIAFALYPAQLKCRILNGQMCSDSESQYVAHRQFAIIASLCYEVNCKEMLRTLLDINLDGQYAMNVALHEMALFPSDSDDRRDRCIDQLVTFLRNVQIESPFANLSFDGISSLVQDEIISLHSYSSHRKTFFDRMRSKATEIVDRESKATDRISMDAMGVTCTVTESQNVPRKSFIRHLRTLENSFFCAKKTLLSSNVEFCHPEGCGHRRKAWFGGWSLDASEGPNRERRKLTPSHITYSERFVLEEHRHKLGSRAEKTPLYGLFGESTDSNSQLNRVELSEGIRYSVGATVVRSTFECFGEILVGDAKLYFFGETAKSTQKGTRCSTITFSWSYSDVVNVFKRDYLLEDTALEIFLSFGDAYLIVFSSLENRDTFLNHISKMPMPRLATAILTDSADTVLHNLTHRWRVGSMTNFAYLMHLNTLAGRSYNDLMQYPVAPFIISDFKSVVLDLESPSSFRNLSRPMAIQDKSMEEHYHRNFHCLDSESKRNSNGGGIDILNFGPYHYGSHYSNSGIVVHYLVRLSPFTNIALEYQDNNFDIADRLFNSIETTWRLASSESTTDFKEAIPEFFYLPEFFQNLNGLDLGVKQNGDRVDSVILPQWCPHRESPLGYRLFCFIHRQALESSVVTAELHNWIDLTFGYKQNGDASVKAVNVFHPATYRDKKMELNGSIKHDELSVTALRTMVRTYGQMPIQLFSSPHLPHLNPKADLAGIGAERPRVPPNLFGTVSGLQWGDFLGSPDAASGRISHVMTVQIHERIARLFAFPDSAASCGGLPPNTAIWYSYGAARNCVEQPGTESRGVISWNFFDNILRFKLIKTDDSVWINLVDFGVLKVSCVSVSYAKSFIFVGFTCGIVHVYHLEVTSSGFALCTLESEVFAHRVGISTVTVSDECGFAVTTDLSGKVCFWDLNKLTFVRSYQCPRGIELSYISPTTGDLALVMPSDDSSGSTVTLLTINGTDVGTVTTARRVTSLEMTSLPEGRAINCIALGMDDGTIRVVEMWTMTEVNIVSHESVSGEIISMQFSSHCKKLYTLLKTGWVHCWQCASGNRGKPPSFHLINPF